MGNAKNTKEIISKYDFAFQKRFGQNFLVDPHVLEKIIKIAGITKNDFVLEIGPGIGTLTQVLAENAREVTAVEIDRMLIPILEDTLSGWNNVTIIQNDILKTDIEKIAVEKNGGNPVKVVANLPYYITTPVIMELLEKKLPLESVTVMVQKEVAERMQASKGTKEYGALSLAVQYYSAASIESVVPPNCFIPRPKVSSCVVHMKVYPKSPYQVRDERILFRTIRASFNQRRKTLANGIRNSPEFSFSREEVCEILKECGIPENIRGEDLSLEEFIQISNLMAEKISG